MAKADSSKDWQSEFVIWINNGGGDIIITSLINKLIQRIFTTKGIIFIGLLHFFFSPESAPYVAAFVAPFIDQITLK